MTPFETRMIEDMKLFGYSKRTQDTYLYAVRKLCAHVQKSVEQITNQELREYLLWQRQIRTEYPDKPVGTLYGVKFCFEKILKKSMPVIELFVKLRVTQSIKMLQEQRFDHQLRVVAGAASLSGPTLIYFSDNLYQGLPVNNALHGFEEDSRACILLFGVEKLVSQGALIVFLNHDGVVSYWYLLAYKRRKHKNI